MTFGSRWSMQWIWELITRCSKRIAVATGVSSEPSCLFSPEVEHPKRCVFRYILFNSLKNIIFIIRNCANLNRGFYGCLLSLLV